MPLEADPRLSTSTSRVDISRRFQDQLVEFIMANRPQRDASIADELGRKVESVRHMTYSTRNQAYDAIEDLEKAFGLHICAVCRMSRRQYFQYHNQTYHYRTAGTYDFKRHELPYSRLFGTSRSARLERSQLEFAKILSDGRTGAMSVIC